MFVGMNTPKGWEFWGYLHKCKAAQEEAKYARSKGKTVKIVKSHGGYVIFFKEKVNKKICT
jgi:hypothetical protein